MCDGHPVGRVPRRSVPGAGPFPSRIFFGWYVVAATVALYVLSGGVIYYGFPVFFSAILAEYPWSKAAAAVAFSIVQLEGAGLSPLWGLLVDRLGTRVPMLVGTALMAGGYLLLSQLDSLFTLYLGFGLAGLGFGVYWTAPIAAVCNWFRTRRTLAIGVAMSGFGLSGCMAPILDWGIEGYGWRAVFVAAGLATIAVGLPLCLLLRHRPEQYGHTVEGELPLSESERGSHPDSAPVRPSFTGREAMRTRAFWVLAILVTLSWIAFTGIVPHMATYIEDVGIHRDLAAFGIMGITIATVIGRIGGGALADRLDQRHVLIGAFLILSVGILIFATISKGWQLLLFLIVAGPSAGALIPIVPALISSFFGTRSFAVILGLAYAPASFVWFGVPSAAGWASDHFGTYRVAWLTLAGLTFAAVPLGLMLQPPPVEKLRDGVESS